MSKYVINMLSSATSVAGQGVGSAYLEQVDLVTKGLSDDFSVVINQLQCADITHYHTIDFKFFVSRLWLTRKGVSVGYVHMLPETVEQSLQLPKWIKKIFFWYMIRFYKSMDYLVTVNPYFIGELAKYGVAEHKVTYIPNFVSEEQFFRKSDDEREVLRREYHIAKDVFTVVCVGQLQTRKGIFDFVEMAKRLPEVQFIWAGGFSFGKISDGYEEIKKIVDNPPQNIKFLGIIDREKMNDVYNLADVMILPSFEELFPMSILEAMCTHAPILLRDIDIYHNILFDFYQKASDVDGFVHQIQQLKEDAAYYQKAQDDSKRGNDFYTRENVLAMWQTFYNQCIKKS